MKRSVQIFVKVADRVTSTSIFNEIIQKQQNLYDIQPYKIQITQGQTMLKMYINLVNKLNTSSGLVLDNNNNNWNQNERRVFVWFIICYTYFLQLDKKQFKKSIYEELSEVFFSKRPQFLHFQHLNLLKTKKRVCWSKQDDELLVKSIKQLTPGKWNQISKKIFYDSERKVFRTPKHCRERWLNHLDKTKKHGEWTSQEDLIIFEYVLQNGKRWSKIVPLLNQTRTEHMIKNRYNSLISKSKGGKKIKEEEIVRKILNFLSQAVQVQQINENIMQQDNGQIVEGQKTQHLLQPQQNTKSLQNVTNNINLSNSPPFQYKVTSMQIGCFFGFNNLFYPQLFFNQNKFGIYQLSEMAQKQTEFSKNSSFSLYQPNERF